MSGTRKWYLVGAGALAVGCLVAVVQFLQSDASDDDGVVSEVELAAEACDARNSETVTLTEEPTALIADGTSSIRCVLDALDPSEPVEDAYKVAVSAGIKVGHGMEEAYDGGYAYSFEADEDGDALLIVTPQD